MTKRQLDRGANPNLCNIDEYDRKSNIPLLCAAHTGSYEVCTVLLAYGADPQARDGANRTALHWATQEHKVQSVMLLKCLLDHGADINARTRFQGRTPLSYAVINDMLPVVNTLLDEGADPDIPDTIGITPLGHAVFNGRTNMVDDLLAHGANPDTPYGTDSRGWSNALCMALSNQDTAIVAMLLAYGANPNKASIKGDTPLHLAIGKRDPTCVDMLLAHGANPNIRNPSGETALEAAKAKESPPHIIAALSKPFQPLSLQVCARNCIRATLMRPQMTPKKTRAKSASMESQRLSLSDPLTEFLPNPLTLNETNSNIRQCLSPRDDAVNPEATARGSHAQPVPSLKQPVASAGNSSRNSSRNSSKSAVACPGNGSIHPSTSDHDLGDLGEKLATLIKKDDDRSALNDLLNLLEKRGIDPNLCDQQGRYPLFWFSDSYRMCKSLKILLDRGIDPNISTIDPLTNKECIPLLLAARKGSYEISKALLDHGADPQAHDLENCTALHFAISEPNFQTVMLLKCLLNHGININARNGMGRTPLCNAVISDKFTLALPCVNTLLDEGADPNIPDNKGNTALHYAVLNGHVNMVDDLLAHGANPNTVSKEGETPLHLAIEKSNMVDDLLAHGASPDTPGDNLDEIGRSSALYEALRRERIVILDMLLTCGANPNKVSKKGDTPLHLAIEKSNSTCVDMLLAHGANPNIRNQSALKAAEAAGSAPCIIAALGKPVSQQICARNCRRATLMRPQMTLKKTRAKPLSIQSQHLPLPGPFKKFVSNPLTL